MISINKTFETCYYLTTLRNRNCCGKNLKKNAYIYRHTNKVRINLQLQNPFYRHTLIYQNKYFCIQAYTFMSILQLLGLIGLMSLGCKLLRFLSERIFGCNEFMHVLQ